MRWVLRGSYETRVGHKGSNSECGWEACTSSKAMAHYNLREMEGKGATRRHAVQTRDTER